MGSRAVAQAEGPCLPQRWHLAPVLRLTAASYLWALETFFPFHPCGPTRKAWPSWDLVESATESHSKPHPRQQASTSSGRPRLPYLGAGLCTVHDGVAAVEREGVLQLGQALLCEFISGVDHPAISLGKQGMVAGVRGRPKQAPQGRSLPSPHSSCLAGRLLTLS